MNGEHPALRSASGANSTLFSGTQKVLFILIMLGLLRSIGHIHVYVGYLAPLAGLVWLCLERKVSVKLLPSYLLVLWAMVSGFSHTFGFIDHLKIFAVLGGIGLAEVIARLPRDYVEKSIAKYWIWLPIIVAVVELIMILLGAEDRSRTLSSGFIGVGLDSDLSIPRMNGSMGGSGYSAATAVVLAFYCFANQKRLAGFTLCVICCFMLSRGPVLAMLLGYCYLSLARLYLHKVFGWGIVALTLLFPLLIWLLTLVLTTEQQTLLSQLSTSRFVHYVSFLNFGLDNPLLGVGYSNWAEVYVDYFWTDGFQSIKQTNDVGNIREAHNLVLDVFGELGLVGWLLIAAQVSTISKIALQGDGKYGAMYIVALVCFTFLSGLSHWTFWFANGAILGHHFEVREHHPRDSK